MLDKKTEFKKKIAMVKAICKEESDRLYLLEDIEFSYDHYDPEVRTIYVRESTKTTNEVTHESLRDLSNRVKDEVDGRWMIGILHENANFMHERTEDLYENGVEIF